MSSATTEVLAKIKTSESRFGPEGIELWRLGGLAVGKTPAWFRKIVQRDFNGRFYADWYDHPSRAGDSLVFEPYDLTGESLRDLLAFADRYAIDLSISATSHHYPTRTIAVFLTPRKKAAA
jgi:hypothetical protein